MAGNNKTIMVVDDSSTVRLYYRAALEAAGFHVDEALNGMEAIEKLLLAPVDMLIVDVNMPKMDGFTFLDVLRQKQPPLCSTPALVTSTESGAKDFASARAVGANFYLVKPIDDTTLVEFASMFCGVTR